jgi:hypothetical protein
MAPLLIKPNKPTFVPLLLAPPLSPIFPCPSFLVTKIFYWAIFQVVYLLNTLIQPRSRSNAKNVEVFQSNFFLGQMHVRPWLLAMAMVVYSERHPSTTSSSFNSSSQLSSSPCSVANFKG